MSKNAKSELDNKSSEVNKDEEQIVLIEEALTRTGYGKFNICLLLLSGVILSTVLLETLTISFVLPVSECDLKLNSKEKGLISGIAFAGIVVSLHFWGFIADTRGRKTVIMPSLLLAFISSTISSLVQSFWLLVVMRFMSGFFISGATSSIFPYLGEFHDNKNRSRTLMGASVVYGSACILMPLLAWLVINSNFHLYIPFLDLDYKPWRFYIFTCGLPNITCFMLMLFFPETPKFTFSQGDEKKTMETLRRMYSINSGKDPKFYNVTGLIQDEEFRQNKLTEKKTNNMLKSMWNQTYPLFMKPHLKNTLIACAMQFAILSTCNGMFLFFPDILNRMALYMIDNPNPSVTICEVLDSTKKNVADVGFNSTNFVCIEKLDIYTYKYSFILEIVYSSGFAIIGLVINSVGKLAILVFFLFGCGFCGYSLIFTTIPLLSTYLIIIFILCGVVQNVVNASTIDLFPTNLRAMAICISLMSGRLGSVVGANLVSTLLDSYCSATFAVSSTLLCISGVLAFFIPNISQRHNNVKKITPPDRAIE